MQKAKLSTLNMTNNNLLIINQKFHLTGLLVYLFQQTVKQRHYREKKTSSVTKRLSKQPGKMEVQLLSRTVSKNGHTI